MGRVVEGPIDLIAYHGTNRPFTSFDVSKSRTVLNDAYHGDGLFFAETEQVAWLYACAARNSYLPREETYAALEERLKDHPRLMVLFRDLVELGSDAAWEKFLKQDDWRDAAYGADGIDPNDLADLAQWVEGAVQKTREDSLTEVFSLFSGTPNGMPDWVVRQAWDFGIDVVPRIITARIQGTRMLETDDLDEAREGFAKGFDIVRYTGSQAVRGVPEYKVASASQVEIIGTSLLFYEDWERGPAPGVPAQENPHHESLDHNQGPSFSL